MTPEQPPTEQRLTRAQREKVAYTAEVFLDFLHTATEGKDDDDPVSIQPELNALAEACGLEAPEASIETAGELRRRYRSGKEGLAKGEGP